MGRTVMNNFQAVKFTTDEYIACHQYLLCIPLVLKQLPGLVRFAYRERFYRSARQYEAEFFQYNRRLLFRLRTGLSLYPCRWI